MLKYNPKNREEALRAAAEATTLTGRKHIVREDYGTYTVCPQYERGREGYTHDAGYTAFGLIVKESM